MKNVIKKQALALLAIVLSVGIAAGAVADTIYVTSGFVIPAARIGGNRPVEEEIVEEEVPAEETEEVPQAVDLDVPVPEEVPPGTDPDAEEKALDDDVAGLSVVDGEAENQDKISDNEDINITEQDQSVTLDDTESVTVSEENIPEDVPAEEIDSESNEAAPTETGNDTAEVPEEDKVQYSEEKIKTENDKPVPDIIIFESVDLDEDNANELEPSELTTEETIEETTEQTTEEKTEEATDEATEETIEPMSESEVIDDSEKAEPLEMETEETPDESFVEDTEEILDDPSDEENDAELDELFPDNMIQIRNDADGMSEITAEVPIGSELQIFERDGDWFLVLCGDIAGYVHITQMPNAESLMDEEEKNVRKVNIFTSRKTMVTEGEPIHLTSMIQGFDDCIVIEYQWEYDRGNGWEDVPGATEPTYTYFANAETLKYSWRLRVHWETPD